MTVTDDAVEDSPVPQETLPSGVAAWTGLRRVLALIAAGACVVLAAMGLFLPLLPSTPFILLASYLLLRSSTRLHQRLRRSRLFGRLLADWEEHRGIRLRDKIRAIAVILICSAGSVFFGGLSRPLTVAVVILVAIGLFVIVRLPLIIDNDECNTSAGPR